MRILGEKEEENCSYNSYLLPNGAFTKVGFVYTTLLNCNLLWAWKSKKVVHLDKFYHIEMVM